MGAGNLGPTVDGLGMGVSNRWISHGRQPEPRGQTLWAGQTLRVALERGKTELEKAPTRHSLFFSSPETTV